MQQVADMHGTALVQEYMRASNIDMVSPSPGFFAIAPPDCNEIWIFGSDKGVVRNISIETDLLLSPLKMAMLSNLEFTVRDEKVYCCDVGIGLGQICANSYLEAAMKAVIIGVTDRRLRQRSSNPPLTRTSRNPKG